MKYKLATLTNGLRVLTVPVPTLESATVTLWVSVGSRYESKETSGLSHFLEHMAFKGSKKRPSAKLIAETIDGIGGEFNAATTYEWTNFYIKARASLIETSFDVLSDMVLNPILKSEDIERERGVILEEIAMKDDTPMEKIGDLFGQLIFSRHPLGRDISGTRETVARISKKDFAKFRQAHYVALKMLVTVAGGVDKDTVLKLSKKYFGSVAQKSAKAAKRFKTIQRAAQVHLTSKKSEQAHFILGFLGYPRTHPDRYSELVLSAILGMGMSSRLFSEVREKRGLAYAVNSAVSRYVDTGVFAVYAGVDLKRVDEAVKVVVDQIFGLVQKKYPISASELKKAKEYIKGRIALALEDTRAVNDFFGQRALFLPKIETPEEVFAKIDKVGVNEVYRVAKDIFRKEKLNLAIIGPYKSQAKFERLLR